MALSAAPVKAFRMVRKSLAMRGVGNTLLYALSWPMVRMNEQRNLKERNARQALFDGRYGTDTGGIIPLSSFTIANPNWVHGVRYAPTSLETFTNALSMLGLSDYSKFTFVDIGSGKGATMLYAADLGFGHSMGIEFVKELNDIAVKNLSVYPSAQGRSSSVCADATTHPMPAPPLIAFFNYPFSSKELTDQVIANIAKAGPGPKYVVAINYDYDLATLPGGHLRLLEKRPQRDRFNYAYSVL